MNQAILFAVTSSILCLISCKFDNIPNHDGKANHLINETSPYLLQHAHNPVDWYPWGDEALARAKKENKLMIISIGYSSCHWCHVMEKESFEDEEVAKLMNENFVCVKVDREERPDVDDIYMTACQLITGKGGWPLNAFATSEAKPFWAGTYFPKGQWISILKQFIKIKAENPEKLEESAEKTVLGIASAKDHDLITEQVDTLKMEEKKIHLIASDFMENYDFENGGRKGYPKFPMPTNLEFLLKYHGITGNKRALKAVTLTLDKMAKGGIYDQVGGGFARYSVDSMWMAPHFEKMLYDNGQLLSIYSEGYKLSKNPLYKKVIDEIAIYLREEMSLKGGGFYSSLDADSEGVEGRYYVWDEKEIDSIIQKPEESRIFKDFFSVEKLGNWEGKNILYVNPDFSMKSHGIDSLQLSAIINGALKKLKKVRSERVKPGLDDKTLLSWNALTIKGLIKAYEATGNKTYLDLSKSGISFIEGNMKHQKSLYRTYKDGKASINAFMDDYAAYIDALIEMYEVTLEKKYLLSAQEYTQLVLEKFFDEKTNMFFYTSKEDQPLITRKKEISDNVIPSSNSMMARNLFALGTILYDDKFRDLGKKMAFQMVDQIAQSRQPDFNGNWCSLLLDVTYEPFEVVITGVNAVKKANELQKYYQPSAYYAGGISQELLENNTSKLIDGETMIFVCQNKTCKLPTSEIAVALGLLKNRQ